VNHEPSGYAEEGRVGHVAEHAGARVQGGKAAIVTAHEQEIAADDGVRRDARPELGGPDDIESRCVGHEDGPAE